MKNLTFYKSVVAFVTIGTMTLFSGCSSNTSNTNVSTDENTYQEEKYDEGCNHLIVYFGNESVTFKECEGFKITSSSGATSGRCSYDIKKDGKTVFTGITNQYNDYIVNHNIADQLFENESIQKVK